MLQTKMTPYEAYQTYRAIRLHFTSSDYDYFKYQGKVRSTPESFEKRNDRYFFEKAAHIYSKEKFIFKMAAEMKTNPRFFIKDIMTKDNENLYLSIMSYLEAFSEKFKMDMSKIREKMILSDLRFGKMVFPSDKKNPVLYTMYLSGNIRPETLIALQRGMSLFSAWNSDSNFSLDPVWNEEYNYLINYEPFISEFIPKKEEIRKYMLDSLKGI